MAIRTVLTFLALLWAAPALADTTAVYTFGDGKMTMTLQIASNGDVRTEMGGTMLEELRKKVPDMPTPGTITRSGEYYFIQPGPDGVVVISVSDAAAVMGEHLGQHPREGLTAPYSSPKFMAAGPVTVHGRAGIAYAPESEASADRRPSFVLSADPALGELRDAMARHFEKSLSMGHSAGFWDEPTGTNVVDLLRSGAPLRIGGMELVDVKHDPIPPERFELPAPPLSREEVRVIMTRKPAPPKDSAP